MQPVRTLGFQTLTLLVAIRVWEGGWFFNVDLEDSVDLYGADIYKGVAMRDGGIEGIDQAGSLGDSCKL